MALNGALGIYVHIPFCKVKCSYCAFVSQVCDSSVQQHYVAALCREISAVGGDFSVPVDTVFFGGGTPSVLAAADLAAVLQAVRRSFRVTVDAEVSLEANPGTIGPESLHQLRRSGFNRLSLGIQSLDDTVLEAIGRIHRAEEAVAAVRQARGAGFGNIGVDLMYGLPRQDPASWRETLERTVALQPDHISAYGLKLEDGTPLKASVEEGRTTLPPEEQEEEMYDFLNRFLPEHGYYRYEISNFAKAGHECRHNMKYWRYRPYRGFGAAAHSFDGRSRFSNTEDIAAYVRLAEAGQSPEAFRETPDLPTAMAEYVFLALRTSQGLSPADFSRRFGDEFPQRFLSTARRLAAEGLMQESADGWRLTDRGFKLSNPVFAEFLP